MDEAQHGHIERWIRELEAFGHRGSATVKEAEAADYLVNELEGLGISAQTERFQGSSSLGARIGLHVVVAGLGCALMGVSPLITILTGALALVSLIYEQSTLGTMLGRLLVNRPSQNVVGQVPSPDGPPRLRLVVMGHYDTQRTGLIWSSRLAPRLGPALAHLPGLMKSPLFPVLLALSLQPLLGVGALVVDELGVLLTLAWILILAVETVAAVLLLQWAFGPFVPGANDNASGTAGALALAATWARQPTPGVELVVLLTGCEETGMLGAAAWADRHREEVDAVPTLFLNLDSLGYGRVKFLGEEHTLSGVPVVYSSDMITLCRQTADERGLWDPGPLSLPVCTDGVAFRVRGIKGATLICIEPDGRMPHYHQLKDTLDRMDLTVTREAVELAWAILCRMARHDPAERTRGAVEREAPARPPSTTGTPAR